MSICNNRRPRFQTRAAARTGWKTGTSLRKPAGREPSRSSRLKNRRKRKSRRPSAVTAAFVAGCQRASKPGLAHHGAEAMYAVFGKSVKPRDENRVLLAQARLFGRARCRHFLRPCQHQKCHSLSIFGHLSRLTSASSWRRSRRAATSTVLGPRPHPRPRIFGLTWKKCLRLKTQHSLFAGMPTIALPASSTLQISSGARSRAGTSATTSSPVTRDKA